MGPGDVFGLLIVVCGFAGLIIYLAKRFFSLREKQLDVDARLAAEKAAQYAVSNAELEQRVRVLEQIVTDNGAQTAAQIEALREQKQVTGRSVRRDHEKKLG
jgi:ABC-type phosphate transport system auxiliary subunit